MIRNYTNTASKAITIGSTMTAAQTSVNISDGTTFPAAPYTARIEDEIVLVTAASGANSTGLTITRGFDGTTGATHGSGVGIHPVVVALDFKGGPDSLTSLTHWWKADAITGKVDNDTITSWADSKGTLALAEATNPPVYKTNIQNGLPVVRFDGTNDQLTATTGIPTGFTSFTFFMVFQWGGSDTNAGIYTMSPGGGNDWNNADGFAFTDNAGAAAVAAIRQIGGDAYQANASTRPFTGGFQVYAHTFGNGLGRAYIDGLFIASDTYSDLTAIDCTVLTVGARTLSGAPASPWAQIDVGEICWYTGVTLSPNDIIRISGYLVDKWGI